MFDAPKPQPLPPPPRPPQYGQSNIGASGNAYLRAQKGGIAATIASSPQGETTPSLTSKKTLLGQ